MRPALSTALPRCLCVEPVAAVVVEWSRVVVHAVAQDDVRDLYVASAFLSRVAFVTQIAREGTVYAAGEAGDAATLSDAGDGTARPGATMSGTSANTPTAMATHGTNRPMAPEYGVGRDAPRPA